MPVRTSRLEAFSDGVLAIIITIMVLELHVPEEPTLAALGDSATGFLTYALSFVYIGIYWNNHHHMFQVVEQINGGVLWANLHLLFWLSLYPFTTAWMDETGFAQVPTGRLRRQPAAAAIAYYTLQQAIFAARSGDRLRAALGRDLKGKLSPVMYLAGILLAFVTPWLAVAVLRRGRALIWLVPDRRVERYLATQSQASRVSADRVETAAARSTSSAGVTGSAATKPYRCPGCHQVIRPATPHTVAWPVLPSTFSLDRHRARRAPALAHAPAGASRADSPLGASARQWVGMAADPRELGPARPTGGDHAAHRGRARRWSASSRCRWTATRWRRWSACTRCRRTAA